MLPVLLAVVSVCAGLGIVMTHSFVRLRHHDVYRVYVPTLGRVETTPTSWTTVSVCVRDKTSAMRAGELRHRKGAWGIQTVGKPRDFRIMRLRFAHVIILQRHATLDLTFLELDPG